MRTDARKKTEAKYRQNKLHRVSIDYRHADFDRVAEAASAAGYKVGSFVRAAVDYVIKNGVQLDAPEQIAEPERVPFEDAP